jgi:nicotinate-nucleotide--dimethylbenzimidazole phosphoribosyltransferase
VSLKATIDAIARPDEEARARAQAELDGKTKPRRSLGRLEELAVQLAGIGIENGRATAVVAAADHGYTDEGVSAYPAEVTGQMLEVFSSGGAAASVLARTLDVELLVVDAGVATSRHDSRIRAVRIGAGTANATRGPAMSRSDALTAIEAGMRLAGELAPSTSIVALGEMGIGNTTAASALHAALLDVPPAAVCGRGTGLDLEGVRRKIDVVERALAANPARPDPVDALAALGGFEIALLVGVALGAAAERLAVVLDGFVVGAAALVAARLAPESVGYMVAAHLSPEPGHRFGLDALGLRPLLDLELRLGEATGALLAVPLLRSAIAIHAEMATFVGAKVTDAGR